MGGRKRVQENMHKYKSTHAGIILWEISNPFLPQQNIWGVAASWPSYSLPHFYKLFAVPSNFTEFYWFSALLVTSHFLHAPSFHQCSFTSHPPPTSCFISPSIFACLLHTWHTQHTRTRTCTHTKQTPAHHSPVLNRMSQGFPKVGLDRMLRIGAGLCKS